MLFIPQLVLANVELPEKASVALTISGNIGYSNDSGRLLLSLEQLQSLPQKTMITTTRWTKGSIAFKGPLLRDVLALAKVQGESLFAVASNEYRVEIPIKDVETYDVILALEKDGKALTMRTKGPIWIMYPWSDNPELEKGKYYSRAIWQLVELNINE
jgi:hypothetical protein